ncbi:hypothetical protein LCGC14_3109420 [marine sediment metagenome]|uniref:Uncharacterized protein n=1 Tax=marine sediment metagenome TaxID=412755 RepID=A0A0F8W5Z2_9ZZZZ
MRWEDRTDRQKVALLKFALDKLLSEFFNHEHSKQGSVLTSPDWDSLEYSDEGTEE